MLDADEEANAIVATSCDFFCKDLISASISEVRCGLESSLVGLFFDDAQKVGSCL